jgi:hypothetical protein
MRKLYIKPWLFGVLAGLIIVLFEAFLNFYPPSAYAFCLTCHARDLLNTIINGLFGTNLEVTFIANRALIITSPAVIAGAFSASLIFREFRRVKAERPVLSFIYGFIVMSVATLIFGCPTRIAVRVGYGDLYGILALVGIFAGIWAGTLIIRSRARYHH